MMSDRKRLVKCALEVLGTEDARARDDVIRVAEEFSGMLKDAYARSARFSDIREALKKERRRSVELARRIDAMTRGVEPLLTTFGQFADEIDRVTDERLELAERLRRNAAWIESLEGLWPKGGQSKTLATEYFGQPQAWLINQCIILINQHGDPSTIQPARNYRRGRQRLLLYDLVCHVYELAIGEEGTEAAGLSSRVDKMVAQWRGNQKKYHSRIEWGVTDGGVKYVKRVADE